MKKFVNKQTLLAIAFAGLAAVPSSVSAVTPTYSPDDLLIGFRTEGSLSSTKDYLIDVGSATQFASASQVLNLGNYSTDLTSLYGSSWYANTGVMWGSFAAASTATTANGVTDPKNTVYASVGTTGIGVAATPWTRASSSAQGGSPVVDVAAVGNSFSSGQYSSTATTTNATIQPTGDASSWASYLYGFGGNISSLDFYPGSIESSFTSSSAASGVLDLFRMTPAIGANIGTAGINTGYLSIDNGGNIIFTPSGFTPTYTGPLLWTGGSGSWSTANNWISNTVATNGSVVGINGAGGTITNDAVSTLGSLSYSNTAGSYTLTGSNIAVTGGITNNSTNTQTISVELSGKGGVVQSSTGKLTLTASNSYSGGTTVSGGTLIASNSYALGAATGALNVTGGILDLGGKTIVVGSTTLAGGSIGNGTLKPSGIIASTGTISATLSGAVKLAKFGTGTLTLWANDNAFTGLNTINAGTLLVKTNSTLGGTVNVAAGGKIILNKGASLSSANRVHTVAGTFIDNSNLAFTNAIKGTIVLAGNGSLQKTYSAGSSVQGFGANLGGGVAFSLLAGYVTNDSTLSANLLTNGQFGVLNFHGTYGNGVVLAFSGVKSSTIKWWDTNVATPFWTNTVAGDTGVAPDYIGYNGFTGSFSTFLLKNSINTNNTAWVSGIMGAYGYDSVSKTAWAVIDHNSYFDAGDGTLPDPTGVNLSEAPLTGTNIQAVPEPSTYALFGLGAIALAFAAYRRRIS